MDGIFISASTLAANRIRDMIFLEKRYKPKDKLPNELELALALGVSRTTVREAVKTLVAENVLCVERGRGTFVTDAAPHLNDPFGLSYLEDKKEVVRNWFEFRLVLEPANARMAVERATDGEIAEILACEHLAAEKISAGLRFNEEDQAFHAAISRATHNSVITLMQPPIIAAINDAIDTAIFSGNDTLVRENALYHHHIVAEYIRKRDAEGAALAMYAHIKRGMLDIK